MKLLLALAILLAPAAAGAAEPLDYRIAIAAAAPVPEVTVTLRLRGDADGETDLDLPDKWAGTDRLWANIGDWQVRGGTIADTDKPHVKRMRHKPGAMLTVTYRVRDPDPLPPGPDFQKALPWIEGDWITLHGEGVIVIPSGREDSPARFAWGSVPKGWRAASDLDTPPATLTANDVGRGIFLGGRDLRLVERRVGGKPLRFALLGQWTFTDAELADHTQAVITAENAMLGAPAIPFLVSLSPLTRPSGKGLSYGGSGRTAGFALEGTPNMPLPELPRTLGHEYGHRWFTGPGDDDANRYWLTEGFNDWFAAVAVQRTGDWDKARWAKEFNATLRRYATSSALALTPQERFDRFWTDPAAMQFPYDEGFLTATILDALLRAAGKPGLLPVLAEISRAGGIGDRARAEAAIEQALPGGLARVKAMLTREGLATLPAGLLPCGTMRVEAGVPQFALAPGACATNPALAGPSPAP